MTTARRFFEGLRNPFGEMERIQQEHAARLKDISEMVAGAALTAIQHPDQSTDSVPQESCKPTPRSQGKLKAKLVLSWLERLPFKESDEVYQRLAKEDGSDRGERQDMAAAAALEVRQATPASLAKLLGKHHFLDGYQFTKKSLEQMIGRLIRAGELPGWSGGTAQKAAASDDNIGHDHDADAEFNPRTRGRVKADDAPPRIGMSIRNRLHRQADASRKAQRRSRPSRDVQAINDMKHATDQERAAALRFFESHPELEEG